MIYRILRRLGWGRRDPLMAEVAAYRRLAILWRNRALSYYQELQLSTDQDWISRLEDQLEHQAHLIAQQEQELEMWQRAALGEGLAPKRKQEPETRGIDYAQEGNTEHEQAAAPGSQPAGSKDTTETPVDSS